MIPDTLGALLAFLGLVAPGLVYQLRREKTRASLTESSFREASRVALVSLSATLTALGVLALLRSAEPTWMPDVGAWLRHGNSYFVDHYRLVFRTALVEVALACALAAAAAWGLGEFSGTQGHVSKRSIWFAVLRSDRPSGKVPWVHVHLKSGADYWGFVGYYSAEMAQLDREISLIGPDLQYRAPNTDAVRQLDANWETVIIAAADVEYIKVNYLPEAT